MGTCPVLPRSRHTDMSPVCAQKLEKEERRMKKHMGAELLPGI